MKRSKNKYRENQQRKRWKTKQTHKYLANLIKERDREKGGWGENMNSIRIKGQKNILFGIYLYGNIFENVYSNK